MSRLLLGDADGTGDETGQICRQNYQNPAGKTPYIDYRYAVGGCQDLPSPARLPMALTANTVAGQPCC